MLETGQFTLQKKSMQHPLMSKMGGSQSQSTHDKEANLLLPRKENLAIQPPAQPSRYNVQVIQLL